VFARFFELPVPVLCSVLGLLCGLLTGLGTYRALRDLELSPGCWPLAFAGLGLLLVAGFVWGSLAWHAQSTPEVRPASGWGDLRLLFHLSLVVLLLIITATDLRSYLILIWCCCAGIVIAVTGAVVSGHFQLVHLWVDWNAEVPQFYGPWTPRWLSTAPHLHGLAWSLTGMSCGIVLTGVIRGLSAWILGINALGSGDVWLMAMVGAYLGWQPVILITLLAPVLALGIGGMERLLGNRAALPYGPFLALATYLVLSCWRWIWMAEFSLSDENFRNRARTFAVRRFFGDPWQMLLIAGLSGGLLVLLLGLLRLYKSLPSRKA